MLTVLVALVFAIGIIGLILIVRSNQNFKNQIDVYPKLIGAIGESEVALHLSRLDPQFYQVLNDVSVYTNGSISQIDHLVVSNYGLFVIETKNYQGWILGYENAQYWTQVIFKFKNRFYNPVLQNRGHIYALKHVLKNHRYLKYHSIIVFTNRSTLMVESNTPVVHVDCLLSVISEHQQLVLSDYSKHTIIEQILASQNPPIQTSEKPIQLENKCPYCRSDLVARSGKYGDFLGCKNFPRCRYTSNVS